LKKSKDENDKYANRVEKIKRLIEKREKKLKKKKKHETSSS
jgi:hypothetical protein